MTEVQNWYFVGEIYGTDGALLSKVGRSIPVNIPIGTIANAEQYLLNLSPPLIRDNGQILITFYARLN